MKKVKITIEAGKDSYGAYSETIDGLYAAGDTIEDCQKDVLSVIELMIEHKKDYTLPQWFIDRNFSIEWTYNTEIRKDRNVFAFNIFV